MNAPDSNAFAATPRTEKAVEHDFFMITGTEYVEASVSRILEREVINLLAERDELKAALEPFAKLDISSADGLNHKDDRPVFGLNNTQFTVGDIRRARALLSRLNGKVTP